MKRHEEKYAKKLQDYFDRLEGLVERGVINQEQYVARRRNAMKAYAARIAIRQSLQL